MTDPFDEMDNPNELDDEDIQLTVTRLEQSVMNRTAAYALSQTLKSVYKRSTVQLQKSFGDTQSCLTFAKFWIFKNWALVDVQIPYSFHKASCSTDPQFVNPYTKDHETKNANSTNQANCFLGYDTHPSSTGEVHKSPWNANNSYGNRNHIRKFGKSNQVWFETWCFGKVTKGARRGNNLDSSNPDALASIFIQYPPGGTAITNGPHSNTEENLAFQLSSDLDIVANLDEAEFRLPVGQKYLDNKHAYGGETFNHYRKDKRLYYQYDDNEWRLKEGDDFTKSGAIVTDFETIGEKMSAVCTCPNGRKYQVGGFGDENKSNFDKSCVGGSPGPATKTSRPHRSVKCHNLGWPPASVSGLQEGCNENNAGDGDCPSKASELYYKDISFSVLYLSTENWRSFRYYHDELAKQVPGPCTFLMKLATDIQPAGQAAISNYLDRQWGWYQQCHEYTAKTLCDAKVQDLPWWADFVNATMNYESTDVSVVTPVSDLTGAAVYSDNTKLYKLYENFVKGANEAIFDDKHWPLADWSVGFGQICKDGHAAEQILDKIAILGHGCPYNPGIYSEYFPGKLPCFLDPEVDCPPAYVTKCDKITRTITSVFSHVGITDESKKCFRFIHEGANGQVEDRQVRFHCVTRAIETDPSVDSKIEDSPPLPKYDLGLLRYDVPSSQFIEGKGYVGTQLVQRKIDQHKRESLADATVGFFTEGVLNA